MPVPPTAGTRLSRTIRRGVTVVVALGAAAAFGLPGAASASPGGPPAPPSVTSVQQRLQQLALRNTQLVEQYDQQQVAVAAKQRQADAAAATARRAADDFQLALQAFDATVRERYEGGAFSVAGALLTSPDGTSYLDRLSTLDMLSAQITQVVADLAVAKRNSDAARQQAADLLSAASAKRDQLARQKATVQAQVDQFTALLATLTAAERAAFQQTAAPSVIPTNLVPVASVASGPVSGAAATAVRFALAQVGKPYVFGAAGPDSYDCSGLTMAAWGAAGVALPHSAADQYNYGRHVPLSALQPGDLIFFYQPIGHVTIYIGNGLMVSAPQPGENVQVVPVTVFTGSITGATRLVG